MPEGTMLVFSTAPGTTASDGTGRNSPFTTAVMQSLKPGFSISQVFTEAAITMKGQEPYIRFDGSGKAMAAFGAAILVPGKAVNIGTQPTEPHSQKRKTMNRMSSEELAMWVKKLNLEAEDINEAYRDTLTFKPGAPKDGIQGQYLWFHSDHPVLVYPDEISLKQYAMSDSARFKISEPFGSQVCLDNTAATWYKTKERRAYTVLDKGQTVRLVEWKPESWLRLDSVNLETLDKTSPVFRYTWTIPSIPLVGTLPNAKPDLTKPKNNHVVAVFYFIESEVP